MKKKYKILQGDSTQKLKEIQDNSIDSIVTDPPYGYKFMGKDWDKALPSIDIWKECLRVLKPGGFAFIMSSPRTDVASRLGVMLEDAGFITSFSPIYWTYASGFPKVYNMGQSAEK
jgi:site-specific DNA-methyltransferase (adenine-specific)